MHLENKKRLEVFGELEETEVPSGEEYLELSQEFVCLFSAGEFCDAEHV